MYGPGRSGKESLKTGIFGKEKEGETTGSRVKIGGTYQHRGEFRLLLNLVINFSIQTSECKRL